jgi:ABC-type polysaccharide/polyol phosphate export permease
LKQPNSSPFISPYLSHQVHAIFLVWQYRSFLLKNPVFIPFQGLREAIKGGDIKAVKKLLSQVPFSTFSVIFLFIDLILTIILGRE